jgi:molybdopterin molybdotransferase
MRGFQTRTALEDVWRLIDARFAPGPSISTPLAFAAGGVLAGPIVAGVAVPPFARAAMDGYALRGEETFGSDPYNPAEFRVAGESRPGRAFGGEVGPGQAVLIMTGAPVPAGADAVVKVESTSVAGDRLRVVEPTPPGRHVGRVGEDIAPGTAVLPAGRVLRPQDLGVLSALGYADVPLVRPVSVAILVTGDELLAAGRVATGHCIPDMNSPMLRPLVRRDGGGDARIVGPIPDRPEEIRKAIDLAVAGAKGLPPADVLLISGGSSTGPEDHAPSLVAERGELLVHGVALRPASPAGVGVIGATAVVLLPGNPVSCLCAYDLIAGRIVRRLGGRSPGLPYRTVTRPLACKLTSALGRTDYTRVRLADAGVEPIATSGASILSSTTRADGFVLVPADCEGYPPGTPLTVYLYDG